MFLISNYIYIINFLPKFSRNFGQSPNILNEISFESTSDKRLKKQKNGLYQIDIKVC